MILDLDRMAATGRRAAQKGQQQHHQQEQQQQQQQQHNDKLSGLQLIDRKFDELAGKILEELEQTNYSREFFKAIDAIIKEPSGDLVRRRVSNVVHRFKQPERIKQPSSLPLEVAPSGQQRRSTYGESGQFLALTKSATTDNAQSSRRRISRSQDDDDEMDNDDEEDEEDDDDDTDDLNSFEHQTNLNRKFNQLARSASGGGLKSRTESRERKERPTQVLVNQQQQDAQQVNQQHQARYQRLNPVMRSNTVANTRFTSREIGPLYKPHMNYSTSVLGNHRLSDDDEIIIIPTQSPSLVSSSPDDSEEPAERFSISRTKSFWEKLAKGDAKVAASMANEPTRQPQTPGNKLIGVRLNGHSPGSGNEHHDGPISQQLAQLSRQDRFRQTR